MRTMFDTLRTSQVLEEMRDTNSIFLELVNAGGQEEYLRGIEESWHSLGESRMTGKAQYSLEGPRRGLMCLLRH